jgi:hypothetical protein
VPHACSTQRPCRTAARRSGRSREGSGRTAAKGDRRAPSLWEPVRLRAPSWCPVRKVGANKAIQISANCTECVCQWVGHIRYENLPASGLRERDIADADGDQQPFGCHAPLKRHSQGSAAKSLSSSPSCGRDCLIGRAARTNPSNGLPKLDAMIHYPPI